MGIQNKIEFAQLKPWITGFFTGVLLVYHFISSFLVLDQTIVGFFLLGGQPTLQKFGRKILIMDFQK
jgi:hypothetical protein